MTAIFCELGASHILTPMLIMEVSTIILAILRADFFTPRMQFITQSFFALCFFVSRIVISPAVYYEVITTMNKHVGDCFPPYLYYVTLAFGGFFHCLNAFCKFSCCLNLIDLSNIYLPRSLLPQLIVSCYERVFQTGQEDQEKTQWAGINGCE